MLFPQFFLMCGLYISSSLFYVYNYTITYEKKSAKNDFFGMQFRKSRKVTFIFEQLYIISLCALYSLLEYLISPL